MTTPASESGRIGPGSGESGQGAFGSGESGQAESGAGGFESGSTGVGERAEFAHRHPTQAAIVRRILRWGRVSWALVGIALLAFVGYSAAGVLSGLVVPSLFALFAGVCLVPVLDWLTGRGLHRRLGALLLIVGLGAVLVTGALVLVRGLVNESEAIRRTVIRAVEWLQSWLAVGSGADGAMLVDKVLDSTAPLLTGAANWATMFVSTAMTLAIGAFLAVFMLYYVLADWTRFREWTGGHLGVPPELGMQIIEDAIEVVRRGVWVLAVVGALDALLVAATMLILDLPFVLGVAVVYFLGCFVPYLGTFIAGSFAILIALGGGGPIDALVLLGVLLVIEIVVRTVVGSWLATDRLALRPLPSIASSVIGVALAGLLGAVLSAPALALAIAVSRRVRAAHAPAEDEDGFAV